MKKALLFITLMLGAISFAQTPQGINYQAVAYDNNGFELANQEISIRLGILLETTAAESSYTETHQVSTNDFGLFSLLISEGNSTDDFSTLNWGNGAFLKVELDANLDGNYTLMGINSFNSVPYSIHSLYSTFTENIPTSVSNEIDSLRSIVEMVSQYFGCKDHDACNYNATATMSDNSCTYTLEGYVCDGECIDTDMDGVCDLDEVEGCTDAEACNYILGATNEDNSCIYQQAYYNCQGDCENDDDGDGICDELEEGCTDPTADNYNPQALSNSSACIITGCMDNTSGNYNPMANQDDGSCIPAEACPYPEYLEYDSTAASYSEALCLNLAVYGCTDYTTLNYNYQANIDDGTCQNIYGCTNPEAVNYDETANTDDGSCLIGGCMNVTAENYNAEAGLDNGTCIIYGCTLSSFPNYNSVASIGDGSCDMNSEDVYGCTDVTSLAYDIDATNEDGTCYIIPIGTLMEGGIVFYLDESGKHGLVAALEDITEGASDPNGWGFNGFEWGCYQQSVSGADGTSIGAGYQNTLDIVAQNCQTENGGITVAQATLNYSVEGYTDWFLPSIQELQAMYTTIGDGGSQDNIGGFNTSDWSYYWSSSENNNDFAWYFTFYDGTTPLYNSKYYTFRVRAVRAF